MWHRLRLALGARRSRASIIPFADVKPPGSRLAWLWHGLGMDRHGFVYLAIGNAEEVRGRQGDVNLFRFDPATGRKGHLGSICEILASHENLGPNSHWPHPEGVAKVHSDIIEHQGILYFATHDLHHARRLRHHRGGHLMSYDPASGRFEVLSRDCPGGVAVENEGIIALNILRERNVLVGWTYPYGHLLLFDLTSRRLERFGRPTGEDTLTNVARVVAVTPAGGIIVSYTGTNAPRHFYRLNRERGFLEPMEFRHDLGFFEGLASSPDGERIHLADTNGDLFVIDTASERIARLGSILPPELEAAGQSVAQLRNLTRSPDGRKLFAIPTRVRGGAGAYHLYEYDIESGTRSVIADMRLALGGAMLTGNGVVDGIGRMYLSCYFGDDRRMFRGYGELSGLARIDISDRLTGVQP